MEQVVGGIYSAPSVSQLPAPAERPRFAEQVRRALQPHLPVTEHVRVAILLGRVSPGQQPAVRTG